MVCYWLSTSTIQSFIHRLRYYPEALFMFYLYGVLFSAPILEQYLFKVFSDEIGYNYTYNTNAANKVCGDIAEDILLKQVQDRISKFELQALITLNLPAIVLIVFFGPLTDRIGRKPIMLFGLIGYTCWCIIMTLVVAYDLDIRLVFLAHFIWGISGYYLSMAIVIIAYVADTTEADDRPFRIAVVDFALFLAITSSNFSSGVILQHYDFLACFVLMLAISVISVFICIFFLRESLPPENRKPGGVSLRTIPTLPRETLQVLRKDRPSRWRLLLLIPLDATVGFAAPITILQVLTLILLNSPYCWPSKLIGFYRGTLFVVMGLGGVVAVKVLPRLIGKSGVIILATFSSSAYLVSFALAGNLLCAYLSILAGIFAFSSQPITRGLISQLVETNEQGAIFSLLGFFQSIVSMIASLSYNAIYIYTNQNNMPGVVLIVASGTMVVPMSICIYYFIKDRKRHNFNADEMLLSDEKSSLSSASSVSGASSISYGALEEEDEICYKNTKRIL